MAAPPHTVIGDQTSLTFDFHDISELGPYSAILRANAGVPPYAAVPTNTFDVGDLYNNSNNNGVVYLARLDGGRRGTPGLEVTVSLAQGNQRPLVVTLLFEPGVVAGRLTDSVAPIDAYNLEKVHEVRLVGHGGGGGRLYQHDPLTIGTPPNVAGQAAITLKQRTVRVVMTTNGFVADNPVLLDTIKTLLPGASADLQILNNMSSFGFNWRAYFLIPQGMRPLFENTVIAPFRVACAGRNAVPYHPLTIPATAIHLDMDRIDQFRRRMICTSTVVNGVRNYGPATLLLSDTRGRKDIVRYSAVSRLGHVRENQRYEAFCGDHLAALYPMMKVVRTSQPVLSRAYEMLSPAIPRPNDMYVYLGYIKFPLVKRIIPRPGSIFLVKWCVSQPGSDTYQYNGTSAFGIVPDLHFAPTTANTGFVMALNLGWGLIKQTAGLSIDSAPAHIVHLTYVQNRQAPQFQLDAMSRMPNITANPSVLFIRAAALRLITNSTADEDIRYGPTPPRHDNALMNVLANSYDAAAKELAESAMMYNITPQERHLLMNVPRGIQGRTQAIQVSIQSGTMRAVYALALALMVNGHRFVFVIDNATDRSRAVHGFHKFLLQARKTLAEPYRSVWNRKVLLHWATVDVQTAIAGPNINAGALPLNDPRNPLREVPALVFKHMLDSLPEHNFCLDENGAYFYAPMPNAPPHHVPWDVSLGYILQVHLLSRPVEQMQFYTEQAEVLNASTAPTGVREKRHHFDATMRAVLATVHALFTDSATAASEIVRASFPTAILVVGNTHRMAFPEVTGVLTAFPDQRAAFVLGDPNDQRPVVLASQGMNEASRTNNRMFWETMMYSGAGRLVVL